MLASHHSGINGAGLSLIVPTSSGCDRIARLCLWSCTVVDSERACGGACRCNASVACAAAAGWKLFADRNKNGWKLWLSAKSAAHFSTFKCKCSAALPGFTLGSSEERRLIAEPPPPPPPSPPRYTRPWRKRLLSVWWRHFSFPRLEKLCLQHLLCITRCVNTPGGLTWWV